MCHFYLFIYLLFNVYISISEEAFQTLSCIYFLPDVNHFILHYLLDGAEWDELFMDVRPIFKRYRKITEMFYQSVVATVVFFTEVILRHCIRKRCSPARQKDRLTGQTWAGLGGDCRGENNSVQTTVYYHHQYLPFSANSPQPAEEHFKWSGGCHWAALETDLGIHC